MTQAAYEIPKGQDMIYCPMCEEAHENNSFCQMPLEGASHELP